ncbi:hypothetical protein VD0002_g2995 [Verticillium dahliae]|uniref:Endoplasmic reticulum protein n=2 Tax=Verticillium dahliae TaxID=27337 RepID=G2XCS1_VERDV|nr:uncharacterized protein VDAG_07953 [Verticillium dahliae VdLs.17]KAF3345549.1 hypothetical protein VdG2_06392 [Verticillium dahliae VDG2]KAH6706841.1 hypothetical protein EV126DRAFT_149652 [Verticillium dahliae]EGY16789.1 hypothetical protein VDAG_07953 [Verticillium dahliae VdLs.17]PNH28330.1 hypothetical protein BJF96_g8358 [Verticillium dahliae]PNH47320.1 hypothetical protein VD0004_g997 [Verticillium dahliae]
MAPPPSADLPVQQRLLQLAQTLQFGWFAGHAVLILCTIRYGFSWIRLNYYSGMAQFSYRTAFVAAAVTYGIVVYKTWRARARSGARNLQNPITILSDENVQYLGMALVWLFAPQYPLALLPYTIYSIFHVATYSRANLIPTISPSKPAPAATGDSPAAAKPQTNAVADKIGAFVKQYYDFSMSIVGKLELALWFRVLLSAILFQRRSWILIVIYTAFLRARFAQSSHIQNSVSELEARVDSAVGNQGTPPQARQVWEAVKNGVRQFYNLTDANRYLSGAAAPKKTS